MRQKVANIEHGTWWLSSLSEMTCIIIPSNLRQDNNPLTRFMYRGYQNCCKETTAHFLDFYEMCGSMSHSGRGNVIELNFGNAYAID